MRAIALRNHAMGERRPRRHDPPHFGGSRERPDRPRVDGGTQCPEAGRREADRSAERPDAVRQRLGIGHRGEIDVDLQPAVGGNRRHLKRRQGARGLASKAAGAAIESEEEWCIDLGLGGGEAVLPLRQQAQLLDRRRSHRRLQTLSEKTGKGKETRSHESSGEPPATAAAAIDSEVKPRWHRYPRAQKPGSSTNSCRAS